MRIALLATALWIAACGSHEDAVPAPPAPAPGATTTGVRAGHATPPAEGSASHAPGLPAGPPRDRERDVAGLTVVVHDDHTITVRGADRWGGRVDTTYESATFLSNALPTLERALTPDQIVGLRAIVDEVGGAAPNPGETR